MDIRQLRYFIAIVESGSFSAAARHLGVAQPALSQHVQSMESAIGMALLHRARSGVTPTEAGVRLLEEARVIDARMTALIPRVRAQAGEISGIVRFGMPGTISEQLGAPLIEAASKTFPRVQIRVTEAMSGFVTQWVENGDVDLALLYNGPSRRQLSLHPALEEEIALFCDAGYPACPDGTRLSLKRVLGLDLILPSAEHGLRRLIEDEARAIGREVTPTFEIDSYRQIKRLVARGLGSAILPATAIRAEVKRGQFRQWRIGPPALCRQIQLCWHHARPRSAATCEVAALAWSIARRMVASGEWPARWIGAEALARGALVS